LIDTSGNSKWQYATPNGDDYINNLIEYKLIDASTDMIFASSGSNYNRILYKSASPYPLLPSSKSYKDPNYSLNRQVCALYITDIDHA
jgi:hypothetical protein